MQCPTRAHVLDVATHAPTRDPASGPPEARAPPPRRARGARAGAGDLVHGEHACEAHAPVSAHISTPRSVSACTYTIHTHYAFYLTQQTHDNHLNMARIVSTPRLRSTRFACGCPAGFVPGSSADSANSANAVHRRAPPAGLAPGRPARTERRADTPSPRRRAPWRASLGCAGASGSTTG